MNTAAGVLKAKLVDRGVVENGVVLEGDVEIAGLIQADTRNRSSGPENLGSERWTGLPVTREGETPTRMKEEFRLFQR